MALIAGLPQAPSQFSPFAHPEGAKARRAYVLRAHVRGGMITGRSGRRRTTPHQGVRGADISAQTSPNVTEHIRAILVARYGNERLSTTVSRCTPPWTSSAQHDAIAATIKGVIGGRQAPGLPRAADELQKEGLGRLHKKRGATFLEGEGKARGG